MIPVTALAIAVAATVIGTALVIVTAAQPDQQRCGRSENGSTAAARNTDCPHRTNSNLPSEGIGIFVVIFAYKFTLNGMVKIFKGDGVVLRSTCMDRKTGPISAAPGYMWMPRTSRGMTISI
jgi:hypothetical protein